MVNHGQVASQVNRAAGRGQSLIVWAIAEGRSVAAHVDAYLSGSTNLPIPISAKAQALKA